MPPEPLVSPCISVCEINEKTGFCNGCFRTRKEISIWSNLNVKQQFELLEKLRLRQGRKRRLNRRNN